MYCKHCGAHNNEAAKFCRSCGKAIASAVPSGQTATRAWKLKGTKKFYIFIGIVVVVVAMIFGLIHNHAASNPSQGVLSSSDIAARVKPAVVYIETNDVSGSGMLIESSGTILTNAHVVSGVATATVILSDGGSYDATVVGRDENLDLAILKIDGGNFPTVTLGDSNNVKQGDPSFTLGYPFGLQEGVDFKDGTVSRIINDGTSNYIETSAQILPGNSGGPLVNAAGQVIGINTATYDPNSIGDVSLGETIKLAIPIDVAKTSIPLLEGGENITISKDELCQKDYGSNSEWSGQLDDANKPTCSCQAGYTWTVDGSSCDTRANITAYCQSQYGSGSYSYAGSGDSVCGCGSGYAWNSDQTQCVVQESKDQICQDNYGSNAIYAGYAAVDGWDYGCGCPSGYTESSDNTSCVVDHNAVCSAKYPNSYWDGTYCSCPDGYKWNSAQTACITLSDSCAQTYPNSISTGVDPTSGHNICDCKAGYAWNDSQTACIYNSGY